MNTTLKDKKLIIGVARHLPIEHNALKWVSRKQFEEWCHWYDTEGPLIIRCLEEQDIQWDTCLSSDLQRAKNTALLLFNGDIETTSDLREVPFSRVPIRITLPIIIWQLLSRLCWRFNLASLRETRKESAKRAIKVIDTVVEQYMDKNVLLVTHGFYMQLLQKELKRRGFIGDLPLHPNGGTVYIFEHKGHA